MNGETEEFQKLAGQELPFYGVDGTRFKLGEVVWEAKEDESDGYRSYLACIEVADAAGLIFFGDPVATVRVEECDEGFRLVDVADGHVWLRVGTDYTDDYYPCFVFAYEVKNPVGAATP